VVGRLMPAKDSLAIGGLPIGLAHKVKVIKPVKAGTPVRWEDVEVDATLEAVGVRREMEAMFRASDRRAAAE
jgi:predicted homoserine dehydrogenase-like protein